MNKIIYICGVGHNGSTFLDLLLGDSLGVVSTSQLNDLHARYVPDSKTRMSDKVWESVLGSLSREEKKSLRKHNLSVLNEKKLPSFIFSRKARVSYARANKPLLDRTFAEFPNSSLVDSSKNVSRCLGLLEIEGYEIYVIHLIRDLRSYVSSCNKRYEEKNQKPKYLFQSLNWVVKNWATTLFVRRRSNHFLQVRYEDFICDPASVLEQISEWSLTDLTETIKTVVDGRNIVIKDKPVFFGNRILSKDEVAFNPKASNVNELHYSFWYWLIWGWFAKPYGYRRLKR